MQLSDFYESMAGFTPVNAGIPAAPIAPNPETQVSPYLRTTLPLPLQYSGDTVKQYNRPGLSSFRTSPLAPAGIPTIVAAAISSVQAATQVSSLVSVSLDIPGIFTPTTQVKQEDSSGLISLIFALAPEIGGTVFLTPITGAGGGSYDNAVTQAGDSSTSISISGSSNASNEFALYWTVSDGAAPNSPNPGAGWVQVSTIGNPLGAGTLYTQYLPSATTVSISGGNLGVDFASILAFVFTNGGAPAIVQKAVNSSGHVGSGTTATSFSTNNTAGNAILVFGGMSNSLSSAASYSVSDTQGNAYVQVSVVANVTGLTAVMYIALNCKAGANTVTLTNTGGSGTFVNAIIEYGNVIQVSNIPVFDFLTGAFIPPIDLSVYNVNGGVKNNLAHSHIAATTVTPGSYTNTNLTVQADGTITAASNGSSSGVTGGVNSQTADYTILTGDAQKIVSLASGSHTFKLPAAIPSASFTVYVENVGSGTLTLNPNGLTLDGSGSNVTIAQNQGMYIATDGSNYFSERGMGGGSSLSLEVNGTPNGSQTLLNLIAGTNVTITDGGSGGVTIAASGGGGSAWQSGQRQTIIVADGTNPATPTLNAIGNTVDEMFSPTKVGSIGGSGLGPAVIYTPNAGSATLCITGTVDSTGGIYQSGKNIQYLFKSWWTTTGDGLLWMGLFNTPNTGNWGTGLSRLTDPGTTTAVSGAAFRCANKSGASLETTWHAYVSNGSASTIVDTTVTQDTAEHTFAIVFNDSVPNIKFYIDGTLGATITTNLPSSVRMSYFLGGWYTATPFSNGWDYLQINSDI